QESDSERLGCQNGNNHHAQQPFRIYLTEPVSQHTAEPGTKTADKTDGDSEKQTGLQLRQAMRPDDKRSVPSQRAEGDDPGNADAQHGMQQSLVRPYHLEGSNQQGTVLIRLRCKRVPRGFMDGEIQDCRQKESGYSGNHKGPSPPEHLPDDATDK